uniref:MADF domain-containing protein n=1 Tax=Acrobeloides nanus TaxID=290746 RepID=A0A914DIT5_9BILA
MLSGVLLCAKIILIGTMSVGEVWNYFEKIDDHFVKCLICGIKLRKAANRSTKTFWNHLNNAHQHVYLQSDRARIGENNMSTSLISITSAENMNFLEDEPSPVENGLKNEPGEPDPETFTHYVEYRKVYKDDVSNIQALNSMLVREVEKYPALYDFNHEDYKNPNARQQSWEKIAMFMKRTIEFVRVRWKTLRDRFKKEQNRIQVGEVSLNGMLWPHYHEMLFILPFVKDRPNPPVPIDSVLPVQMFLDDSVHVDEPMKSATTSILDFANNVMKSQEKMNELLNSGANADFGNDQKFSSIVSTSSGSTPTNSMVATGSDNTMNSVQCQKNYIVRVTKPEYMDNYGDTTQSDINDYYPPAKQPKLPTLEDEDPDDEDMLFCRIIMKKLKKMDEHRKEMAKAKILETLVQVQYG